MVQMVFKRPGFSKKLNKKGSQTWDINLRHPFQKPVPTHFNLSHFWNGFFHLGLDFRFETPTKYYFLDCPLLVHFYVQKKHAKILPPPTDTEATGLFHSLAHHHPRYQWWHRLIPPTTYTSFFLHRLNSSLNKQSRQWSIWKLRPPR